MLHVNSAKSHREGRGTGVDVILFKLRDNGAYFSDSLSWKADIVLTSAVHMKSDRNSCHEGKRRAKERGP